MRKTKTKIVVYFVLMILILNSILIVDSKKVQAMKPYFTLVAKFNEYFDYLADYLNLISQQLGKIGIGLDVISTWSPPFWGPWEFLRNFDMATLSYHEYIGSLNLMGTFGENGSNNVFGYHTDIDWDEKLGTGKNQWYLEQMSTMLPSDSEERISLVWEWEEYLMDEILLAIPLTNEKTYRKYWNNLEGYNFTKGILESWGKLSWNGMHIGKENLSELVISKSQWESLNPLFLRESQSNSFFHANLIQDPLFWLAFDYSIKPHLAKSYSLINETHIRINLREGIKWQTDPDGNFPNEYFDAKDVYFTLFCCRDLTTSDLPYKINWLEDMKIIDSHTIDIFIDANHYTAENEPYPQFLEELCKIMLPEHYLNQTQLSDGVTPDTNDLSWSSFRKNGFGTGIFELKSNNLDFDTVLRVNPECWWLNSTIISDPLLDWQNRFGSFSSNISQLRIMHYQNSIEAMLNFEDGIIDISPDLKSKPIATDGCNIQNQRTKNNNFLIFNIREVRTFVGNRELCPNDLTMTKGLAIRKAIAYAINKNDLNEISHRGEYYIIDNPFYEANSIWCNPNIEDYNFNLETAKYYLELAGFITIMTGLNPFDLFFLTFSVFTIILVFKRKQIKNKM
ncbi:MAG: ABC transporter substrate-binding protein [Candidatus Heimdallarchaeota archaeon]